VAANEDKREALDLALAAVAESGRADELMLRGSALMSHWYPAEAREPGDLDFVVISESWRAEDPSTEDFFEGLAREAERISQRSPGRVRIDAAGAKTEGIWQYDRAPGQRLTMPYAIDDAYCGAIQLDFVFGEVFTSEPETATIALSPGNRGVPLRIASKPSSLAWKLCWLLADWYPEAKDLYDAVLLAEDDSLDRQALRGDLLAALESFGEERLDDISGLINIDVEPTWSMLKDQYPDIDGTAADWLRRLMAAMRFGA
jgi:hypothetical protein